MSSMFSPIKKILFYGVIYTSVRMLVGAISAIYLLAKGVDILDVGTIKAFQAGVIMILDIPLAYVADQKSRKLSVIGASLFSALWLYTMGISETLWVFYLAEFFNSVSLALFSGSFTSYLIDKNIEFDKSKQNIQKIIGKFNKYQHAGMAVSATLGAFFITVESQVIWFISCFLMVLLTASSVSLLPKDTIQSKAQDRKTILTDVLNILKDILTRIEIKWIVLMLIFITAYYQSIIQFWQLVISIDKKNLITEGHIYGIIFAAILLIQSLSGYLVEKLPKRQVFYVALCLTLALLPYPLFMSINYLYSTSIVIIVLFFIIRSLIIVLHSVVHENITSKLRSTYDSAISTIVRIILLIMLPSLGFLVDQFGFISLYLLYVFIFFSFIACMLLNRHLTSHSSGWLRRR